MMSTFNHFNNKQVEALPRHLRQYIVDQHYEKYTAIDQAVWRYVMRQNYSYLKEVAYYPYIKGLERAGLSINRIPDLQHMNDSLGQIGWGAVTVDGFIPPSAFMEYQAHRVLVIAADIRQLQHIEYTPAPDIIHESAGHAPIIADVDYHNYLSYFGSIGSKAMFSSKDFELYEAIRKLSILKEADDSDSTEVADAERKLKYLSENMGQPSEMALLSRLHWWTVEYGLIGSLDNPKIYGAGLLSSIGESASCMNPKVKKLSYTIDAINYPYDITKEQPQLFVTPTFQNLIAVLEEFAATMAFKTGGLSGLLKAIECKNTATAVYSSGLQVSGKFVDVGINTQDEVSFVKTSGPTALSVADKQLNGHGKNYHKDGFSSPVGRLKNTLKPLEDFSRADLAHIGIQENKAASLAFQSGICVEGIVKELIFFAKKLLLISFEQCTVTASDGSLLFQPEWGTYDMAVGEKVVSVYNGAADKDAFDEIIAVSNEKTKAIKRDEKTEQLILLYQQVAEIREKNSGFEKLSFIFEDLKANFRKDWLCALQILEILSEANPNEDLQKEVRIYLEMKAGNHPEISKLIHDGLYLCSGI